MKKRQMAMKRNTEQIMSSIFKINQDKIYNRMKNEQNTKDGKMDKIAQLMLKQISKSIYTPLILLR